VDQLLIGLVALEAAEEMVVPDLPQALVVTVGLVVNLVSSGCSTF